MTGMILHGFAANNWNILMNVKRIFQAASLDKRIEKRTVRKREVVGGRR